MSSVKDSPAWKKLEQHYADQLAKVQMRDLFESDPKRFERFSLQFQDILFDYSKNILVDETLKLLLQLAQEANLKEAIERMFNGEKINFTEKRAVLHIALRNRSNRPIYVDGVDVMPEVNAVLAKMRKFTKDLHLGTWKGYTGKKITDVVNIGIGGSDLGPVMVCNALKWYAKYNIEVHFVSNIGKFRDFC